MPRISLILCLATTLAISGCDRVTVNNSGGEVGLLVDGQSGPTVINDFRVSLDDAGIAQFRVGNYTAATPPARNEVIGFGEGRAPTRLTTQWTPGEDSFNFGLEQPIDIDLTFWIVQGPVGTATFRINDGLTLADQIWEEERTGLAVGNVQIIDATNDPDITDAILNSVGGNNRNWDDFSDDIGLTAGMINIYYINTVEGAPNMGWSDFGARIVMAFETWGDLLAHEIGHALWLAHPEDGGLGAQFGSQNLMTSSPTSRKYLTEGQTFRAHFYPDSAINAVYGARPGQPTALCDFYAGTPDCPDLVRRLWDDGNFAPN